MSANDFRKNSFWLKLICILSFVIVLGLAVYLRVSGIDQRLVHADESTGAWILAKKLETGNYTFDKTHFHGPSLSSLSAYTCHILDLNSWSELTVVNLRLSVVLASILTLFISLFLVAGFSNKLLALAMVGTSPYLVYYSSMYIHEGVMMLFSAIALCGMIYLMKGRNQPFNIGLLVIGVSGMAASKETFVISIFCWGGAWVLYSFRSRMLVMTFIKDNIVKILAFVLLTFLFTSYLYSSNGKAPLGIVEFLKSYFAYELTEGHEKGFFYYLEMLLMPKHILSTWWTEVGVLLAALGVYFYRGAQKNRQIACFIFESGLLQVLFYSCLSYKTPWLVMIAWFHICLAASYGVLGWLSLWEGWRKKITLGIVVFFFVFQISQAWTGSVRFPNDSRNPYSYVPTSRDVLQLGNFLDELLSIEQGEPNRIVVAGKSFWPLPWYLKDLSRVEYYSLFTPELTEAQILILTDVDNEGVEHLSNTHYIIYQGLRPEYLMVVAIENDLWNKYLSLP